MLYLLQNDMLEAPGCGTMTMASTDSLQHCGYLQSSRDGPALDSSSTETSDVLLKEIIGNLQLITSYTMKWTNISVLWKGDPNFQIYKIMF